MEEIIGSNQKFFTFLIKTDGIEMCNKSDNSIWPMILVINEIPLEQRISFDNIIIAGLSVANGKPNLNGLIWMKAFINMQILIAGVFDKPARSCVLNFTSSTGYFSCLKCLQKGERVETELGTTQTYPFYSKYPDGPKRTSENSKQHLNECLESSKKCYGVKDKSILGDLKYYCPVQSTSIDSMHTFFLGVVKIFLIIGSIILKQSLIR
ncbi:unnamed protein product [Brachionus calyciflorus]|uniref:Uncharacterized protein n=1 Tax=Brachionus calyciflorus TaxID=104777 RepID=A0A814QRL6_9BILA|nr:unnamed protein product [Brachionus calyciflorus]